MVKLQFPNGTIIENLKLNGNTFVSEEKVDESLFADTISELTVIEDNETSIMHNVIFVNQVKYDDGWYLALTELSKEEVEKKELMDSITELQLAIVEMYESGAN